MTVSPLVLDADGLTALCETPPPTQLRALLNEAEKRGRQILVPAVTCAEVCRGVARTRQVETVVSGRGQPQPIEVVPTDFDLARQVGAVMHGVKASSADIADAHVIAVCASEGGGLVLTSDSGDIQRLAAAVPSARIVARSPR